MDTHLQRECPPLPGWLSKWISLSHPLQIPISPIAWRTTKGTQFMGRCLALKCLKWGCWNPTSGQAAPSKAYVQVQAPRRHISTEQNVNIPPDLRTPPTPMTQLPKGGPSHCAYPCNVLKALVQVRLYSSGVLGLGQDFQQLIIWKEVEPTNTEKSMRRGSVYCSSKSKVLASWGTSLLLKTLPLTAHWSLCICVDEQPSSSPLPFCRDRLLPLQKSVIS